MKKIKNFILYPVIVALVGATLSAVLNTSGVLAYLTNSKNASNQLTRGHNEIQVVENFPDTNITVGTNTLTKDVTIKNTGPVPCYIRVFIDFADDDIRKASQVSANGSSYVPFDTFKTSALPSGWTYVSSAGDKLNSYFYYTSPVAPGASTTSLIKSIRTTFADQYDLDDYDVIVYAESVQTLDKNGQPFTGSAAWRSAWEQYIG